MGLAPEDAAQRLRDDGANRLPEDPGPSRLALARRQLANALVLLLAVAAIVSLAIGETLDAAIIAAIVVANGALGYIQERRAEQAVRGLSELIAPTARTLRDGALIEIPAELLVGGDVVRLRAGDRVPADGRLLDATAAELDESTLTGESLPVAKRAEPPVAPDAPLAERPTMAFAGTVVTRGTAWLLVTSTGGHTEVGRIAHAGGGPPARTPLQQRLDRLAAFLLRAAGAICVGLGLLAWIYGESIGQSFLIGVSLAVAAVPEGLPAVVTIVLAIGVRRMAEQGAIVRRLPAVETLGSTTVICTDKTGTLTQNRMRVARLYATRTGAELDTGRGEGGDEAGELLATAILASEIDSGAGLDPSSAGVDPTEAAIAAAAAERGISLADLLREHRVVAVTPFDSERKRMSVLLETPRGTRLACVKGAPEVLVPMLATAKDERNRLTATAHEWATDGIRVLLIARREPAAADPEADLEPLGLIGIADPPRPSARASVEEARRAGVRTIMITGDHPSTARAIARATGIGAGSAPLETVTGPELDRISDRQLEVDVGRVDVFARVAPAHKLRVVDALKRRGEVVAMTGDGVNDAPALRAAHIGVAMGGRGTDVAKAAADMVLTDDNYSTIVAAIRRGRTIYENVLRFIAFLLAANAGEVLLFALAIAPGLSAPLTVLQILVVNLLTDGLPAIALGLDPPSPGTMQRPPRPPRQSPLGPVRGRLAVGGIATGAAAFTALLIGETSDHATAQTMAFTTVLFAQLAYVFAVRGDDWWFRAGRNPALYGAVALSAGIGVVVLAVPGAAERFGVVALSGGELAAALLLALVPFVAAEAFKALQRRRR